MYFKRVLEVGFECLIILLILFAHSYIRYSFKIKFATLKYYHAHVKLHLKDILINTLVSLLRVIFKDLFHSHLFSSKKQHMGCNLLLVSFKSSHRTFLVNK